VRGVSDTNGETPRGVTTTERVHKKCDASARTAKVHGGSERRRRNDVGGGCGVVRSNDRSAWWTREERVKKRARLRIPKRPENQRVGETRQKRARNDAERLERERQGRRKRLPGSLALLPKPVSVCYGLKKKPSRTRGVYTIYIFVTRQRSEKALNCRVVHFAECIRLIFFKCDIFST